MKSYIMPVYVTTGFLLVYITAIVVNLNTVLILFMFSVTPAFIFWMAYSVLTAKVKCRYTFDQKWYEDT